MFKTISQPAHVSVTPVRKPKSLRNQRPIYAVLEVEVGEDYRPKNADSSPCDELAGIPAELVYRFAAMYNADVHTMKNKRWACVGLNGCMFFLNGIQIVDRPGNPAGFPPPGAKEGLTYDEAHELQETANSARMLLARVPLRWTVALRPLIESEGGVA